jgi:hypothetical protein
MSFVSNFFSIAGINIQVNLDTAIVGKRNYSQKLTYFQVNAPTLEQILLHHHFALPELRGINLGEQKYRTPPWAIYKNQNGWIYLGITTKPNRDTIQRVGFFNRDHTSGKIYSPEEEISFQGDLQSLSLFPTDQIWLAQVLADRQGCYLHAAGMILNGLGLLFVGHSGAGKSTIVTLLQDEGEILCDDRMILRRWTEGFKIHGTWSHGDIPVVSPNSAPLRAILLLEQAPHNQLIPITDHKEIVRTLPFFVVKPLVTVDWWAKTLDLVGQMAREVPVYRLQFDKRGGVLQTLKTLN